MCTYVYTLMGYKFSNTSMYPQSTLLLLSHVRRAQPLGDRMEGSPSGPSVHGILQARILEWVAVPSSRGSSQPRDWTRSPTLQADSLSSKPPGKPKNTGIGSLSLLQGIFPSQESNWGLLHSRQILYHLSHQGSYSSFYRDTCYFTQETWKVMNMLPARYLPKYLQRYSIHVTVLSFPVHTSHPTPSLL